MGIRFSCPNGHQLNVKAFLAGKRAKCPQCGAKVRVPRNSNGTDETGEYARNREVSVGVPLPGVGTARGGGYAPAIETPQWFVRLPSGGQYGPAPDATIASWIREGRIAPDAWVWREGWTDWQPAEEAFSHLGLGPAPVAELPEPDSLISPPSVSSSRSARLHRQKQDRTIMSISLLALATIVLFAILIWILTKTG